MGNAVVVVDRLARVSVVGSDPCIRLPAEILDITGIIAGASVVVLMASAALATQITQGQVDLRQVLRTTTDRLYSRVQAHTDRANFRRVFVGSPIAARIHGFDRLVLIGQANGRHQSCPLGLL